MPKLKIVIFDCDGVLFDSKEANRHYYNHIRLRFGHPPIDDDELIYVHTHHVMNSIKHIFRHYPNTLKKADEYRCQVDYMLFLEHMIMEPDLPEFIKFLKPHHKTAISTNRTSTMSPLLKTFKLTNSFDQVVTALDVKQPKPHPEALIKILDHFTLNVEEAVFIGDSMVDQEHAAAIGMRFIAFKNSQLAADYHVTNFMDISRLPLFD